MPLRIALFRDQLWAEVLLGRQLIVHTAAQSKVRGDMRALLGKRLQVMKLEVASLAAALAPCPRDARDEWPGSR